MDVRKEKAGEFIELFDAYGEILTETQREICKRYLEYDLSLGEIAEEKGVSRQSVSDCLKKSCERLKFFEKSVGLIALRGEISERQKTCDEAFLKVRKAADTVTEYLPNTAQAKEGAETLRLALANLEKAAKAER